MTSLFDSAIPHPHGYRDVDVHQLAAVPTTHASLVDVREPSELLAGLHHTVAPESPAPIHGQGPSREALTALLDALQATPPSTVRDAPGFERLLRECRDLLCVARPGAPR